MTKSKPRSSVVAEPKESARPAVQFLPPLKPRPRLTLLLLVVVVMWLAALIVMRLTTVHKSAEPPPVPAGRP